MRRRVTLGDLALVPRGAVVVVVPIGPGEQDAALLTVRSVGAHDAGGGTALLGGYRPAVESVDRAARDLPVSDQPRLLEHPEPLSAGQVVTALIAAGAYDIAILAPGTVVAAGWLEGLRAAALSDATVASASPLALGVHGLDLDADKITPAGEPEPDLDSLAQRVSARSQRARPRTVRLGPCCVYLNRPALELLGSLPSSTVPGETLGTVAGELSALGLLHVVADDVLVDGRRSTEVWSAGTSSAGEAIADTLDDDHRSPLRRVAAVARAALSTTSVTIDARALVAVHGGTQTYIRGLVPALARRAEISLRVLLPDDPPAEVLDELRAAGPVETIGYASFVAAPTWSDVVHRPQQVFTADDLELMRLAGGRLVIGHQDLIAYHNRFYHASVDRWRSFRRATRLALGVADQVVFFSEHARSDALAETLVEPDRTHVVGIGPPDGRSTRGPERRPQAIAGDEPFLLCLGADYAHKNRPFAVELLAALRSRGWRGRLVLAGGHVESGSSRGRERELLSSEPELSAHVIDVGAIAEAERNWCFANARAIVYPSLYEGFGLLPTEAAAWGVPCLFAPQASLAEIAPESATLVPWDADATAERVEALLHDGPARKRHLTLLEGAHAPSWDAVADSFVAIYARAIAEPPPAGAPRTWEQQRREAYVESIEREMDHLRAVAQEYQDAHHELERRVAIGLRLIDWGGALSPQQQRGMLRLIDEHPRLASLTLAPLHAYGRDRA
jgi:glycosyltransferase involved in cell wall biosynthesis